VGGQPKPEGLDVAGADGIPETPKGVKPGAEEEPKGLGVLAAVLQTRQSAAAAPSRGWKQTAHRLVSMEKPIDLDKWRLPWFCGLEW
jgi:hypothetical protein